MDCGSLYLTLNKDGKEKEDLMEVRLDLGKSGHCVTALLNCIGRLISALLQTDLERAEIVRLIKNNMLGISCGTRFRIGNKELLSCLDFSAIQMLEELKIEELKEKTIPTEKEEPLKDGKVGKEGKKE